MVFELATFPIISVIVMSTMLLEEKKIEDKAVDRLMDKFTSNLDADNIVDKCLSKGLITENDLSRIGATLKLGSASQAVRDLMLSVKRSAPGYLKTFCGILNDSKSNFLVPCIEEEYRVQSVAKGKPNLIPPITNMKTECNDFMHMAEVSEELEWEHMYREMDCELLMVRNWSTKEPENLAKNARRFDLLTRSNRAQAELTRNKIAETIKWMEEFLLKVHQRQGILYPEKESKKIPLENGHSPMLQAVPNMLLEVGDVLEDASVKASVVKCKKILITSDNVHSQFTETIRPVLDTELTWKKIVKCFSSVAGFGIHLCSNNMSHLATQVYYDWMPQIMQYRLQPWIDDQGGWVSTILG